ncbi:hypothetical protein D1604_12865 [Brevundimonas sp. LPMIX5]|uniref:hypothetical protein n=1 Tax=Brevundimonas sp. LPMIX5 TaxID=2305887 RepID=UPI000E66569B|nr:hypothetical protein [Brevundimonas sp. LPMIX5]RIJ65203.1 hypothetical protein D1604_12865 [Brevundimonas sp. LPMIX5]
MIVGNMTLFDFIPVAVLATLMGMAVLQRQVSRTAQKTRLVLARKGEAFLARTDVPSELRQDVERWLEDPFPCNCFLGFLLLPVLPIAIWISLANGKNNRRYFAAMGASHEARASYLELRSIMRKLQLANHPIMTPLSDLVVTLSLVVATPFLLLSHKASEASLDRDGATVTIDEFWSHLPKLAK